MGDKKKTRKLTPSEMGAKMYMSDEAKKAQRARPSGGTALEEKTREAITKARVAKKLTPKASGTKKADTYIDMSSRAYGNDAVKKAAGGMCRGMGAATKGGQYARSK